MNELKTRGIKSFAWDFIGKLSTQGITFIVTIFLARLLEPSDFGTIAIILVIVGIATIFSDIGLGSSIIQRKHLHSSHYSTVFYFNIIIGSILTIITFFAAPYISHFYDEKNLEIIIKVISPIFLLNSLISLQNVYLQRQLNFKVLSYSRAIASLCSGIIAITLAYNDFGIWSLVFQIISLNLFLVLIIWVKSEWRPNFVFSVKALLQLWGFGFNIFLARLLDAIYEKVDFLIIGKLFPFSILGFFERSKSLNNIVVTYTSGSLMAVLFPILSKIQNNLEQFKNVVLKVYGILTFIVFMIVGILHISSNEIILILFGEKWQESIDIFKILVLSGFVFPLSALLVSVLSSRGKSKQFLILEVYKKIIISLNFITLYFYGIEMYLYGMIISLSLCLLINILFVCKEINLNFYLFLKPLIIQLLIATFSVIITILTVSYLLNYENMFILLFTKTLIFTSIYVLVSYIFKINSLTFLLEELKLRKGTK